MKSINMNDLIDSLRITMKITEQLLSECVTCQEEDSFHWIFSHLENASKVVKKLTFEKSVNEYMIRKNRDCIDRTILDDGKAILFSATRSSNSRYYVERYDLEECEVLEGSLHYDRGLALMQFDDVVEGFPFN